MPTDARPTRPPIPQLWDDEAFRKRLAALAKARHKSVKEVMTEIGLTVEYAYRGAEGRNSNLLMVVADYFGISPATLAGWPSEPPNVPPPPQVELPCETVITQPTLRMLFIASLALSRPNLDPAALREIAAIYDESLSRPPQSG